MILWCDGAHGARENMRRDTALLDGATGGSGPGTVLRLFAFEPAGITLGHNQDPARELDLARAARDGIEWAVRPTGGRAIFHEHEWTFSLVTTLGSGGWAAAPAAAYDRTCRLMQAALRTMGVPAGLSAGTPRGAGSPRAPRGAAAPCFASAARHELALEGRKLAGIAQRAVRGALLQQGSLLLGPGHLRLVDYLAIDPARREGVRELLRSRSTDAGVHLGAGATLAGFADALATLLPGARRMDGGTEPPPSAA